MVEFIGLASYDLGRPGGAFALLVAMLAVGACIHVAARMLLKKDDIHRALVSGMAGMLLAHLAFALVPGYWIVGVLLGVVAFMLTIGLSYRAKPQGAASVGALAWVLWVLANLAVTYVQAHWKP